MDILINGGTIIQRVYEEGAEIMLEGDKVRVHQVSLLSEKLRTQLQSFREDVVHALQLYPIPLIRDTYQKGVFDHGLALDESEIIRLIPPSEWKDISQYDNYELRPWASAIALRAIRYRGIVPRDWNKVTKCSNCGWVFSFSTGDCEPCPWCEIKSAEVYFPTPGLNRCTHPKLIDGVVIQECEIGPNHVAVIIPECFFCGEHHMHGSGSKDWEKHIEISEGERHLGHRLKHCIRNGIEMKLEDGNIVCNEQGYFLGTGNH